jgi:hypothetical protein
VIAVREFADPTCPAAFAAEPARWRFEWRWGDQVSWEVAVAPRGQVTADELAAVSGMPVERAPRGLGAPSIHACRAVVGARLGWPGRERALLRRLRVLILGGEPADDSDTFELAAAQAGIPVRELAAFCAEPVVEEALRADMAAGRVSPAFELDGRAVSLDEVALPDPRPAPGSVAEVLEWAGTPLATAEVAAVCGRDVRDELARVARFEPVAGDGYWTMG